LTHFSGIAVDSINELATILDPAACDHADNDVRRSRISQDQLEAEARE
jgi:hypothetical protein